MRYRVALQGEEERRVRRGCLGQLAAKLIRPRTGAKRSPKRAQPLPKRCAKRAQQNAHVPSRPEGDFVSMGGERERARAGKRDQRVLQPKQYVYKAVHKAVHKVSIRLSFRLPKRAFSGPFTAFPPSLRSWRVRGGSRGGQVGPRAGPTQNAPNAYTYANFAWWVQWVQVCLRKERSSFRTPKGSRPPGSLAAVRSRRLALRRRQGRASASARPGEHSDPQNPQLCRELPQAGVRLERCGGREGS